MTNSIRSSTPHDRLRSARERAGYRNASDFARAAGVNYTTYAHHENGRREIKPEIARLYARLLNLPAGTLLYGEQLPSPATVPIVATVSSNGKIQTIAGKVARQPHVTLPDPIDLVGTQVVGDDLYPAYRDGDVVFHRALRTDRYDPEILNGLECAVQLADGTLLLRQVAYAGPGKNVTLFAHQTAPVFDAQVIAASPIEIVLRKMPTRYSNQ